MLLTEYAADVAQAIDDYSRTGLIIDSEIATDARALKLGLVRGTITFVDESRLFFTEYLDLRYKAEKLTYSFHYQERNGTMLFRYDCARHKPDLGFSDHKHLGDGSIIKANPPCLTEVLGEVVNCFL